MPCIKGEAVNGLTDQARFRAKHRKLLRLRGDTVTDNQTGKGIIISCINHEGIKVKHWTPSGNGPPIIDALSIVNATAPDLKKRERSPKGCAPRNRSASGEGLAWGKWEEARKGHHTRLVFVVIPNKIEIEAPKGSRSTGITSLLEGIALKEVGHRGLDRVRVNRVLGQLVEVSITLADKGGERAGKDLSRDLDWDSLPNAVREASDDEALVKVARWGKESGFGEKPKVIPPKACILHDLSGVVEDGILTLGIELRVQGEGHFVDHELRHGVNLGKMGSIMGLAGLDRELTGIHGRR